VKNGDNSYLRSRGRLDHRALFAFEFEITRQPFARLGGLVACRRQLGKCLVRAAPRVGAALPLFGAFGRQLPRASEVQLRKSTTANINIVSS
jgi:hypothetical protein